MYQILYIYDTVIQKGDIPMTQRTTLIIHKFIIHKLVNYG